MVKRGYSLDEILDTKAKIRILRFFILGASEARVTGRQIAKSIKMSPPATHDALKILWRQGILNREIIGKQHIYSLNSSNKLVKDILRPSLRKEVLFK
ncbi:MAG: winged helix-turn-helix domain-containing protein [Candidatus Omnitrophica bacterium]|nr:winged helix-turn-helix domain-containing protein [Candidatus Omnitrophota bacterium]